MRDLVAIVLVVLLVVVALTMATSLRWYRRSHQRRRERLTSEGQRVIAEVPVADGLTFFSEDADAFYWSEERIDKRDIKAAAILISGATLFRVRSSRFPDSPSHTDAGIGTPEPVERERWDVRIDTTDRTVLVECGSIRQQVSQEMARSIFESVKHAVEARDGDPHHSRS